MDLQEFHEWFFDRYDNNYSPFYNIGSLANADDFTTLCKKYQNSLTIDVYKGRYMIDGCSILGVISFSGNTVTVVATSKDGWGYLPVDEFYKELTDLNIRNRMTDTEK